MPVGPQTIKHSTVAAKSVTPRRSASAAGGTEYVVEMAELYTGCTQTLAIAFYLAVIPAPSDGRNLHMLFVQNSV